MENEKKWYVIHTYSGYENKVKANIERKIASMGMEDEIARIVVPVQDVETKDKNGNKKIIKRKLFPGYVLVEMEVNDRSWYVVRNTPGVTGFIGSAIKPIPLSPSEVRNILKSQNMEGEKKVVYEIDVEIGEKIIISSGPFESFVATITEINAEKGLLKGLVSMFGRETLVEFDVSQVKKTM